MPTLNSFRDLEHRMDVLAEDLRSELDDKVIGKITARLMGTLPGATPIAEAGSAHPGLMRRSWKVVPGSPSEPQRVVNQAPHAIVIEKGRRKGRHSRKTGGVRMQGSKQAPRGVAKPTIKKLEGAIDDIIADSMKKVLK